MQYQIFFKENKKDQTEFWKLMEISGFESRKKTSKLMDLAFLADHGNILYSQG